MRECFSRREFMATSAGLLAAARLRAVDPKENLPAIPKHVEKVFNGWVCRLV
jgi:hypothetical protein